MISQAEAKLTLMCLVPVQFSFFPLEGWSSFDSYTFSLAFSLAHSVNVVSRNIWKEQSHLNQNKHNFWTNVKYMSWNVMPHHLPSLHICQCSVPAALPPRCTLSWENVSSLQTKRVLVSTGRQGLEGRLKGSLCEGAGAFPPVAARHAWGLSWLHMLSGVSESIPQSTAVITIGWHVDHVGFGLS